MSGPLSACDAWEVYTRYDRHLACPDCQYLTMVGEGRCAAHDVNPRCVDCGMEVCRCDEEGTL